MQAFYNPFYGSISRSQWWIAQFAICVFLLLGIVTTYFVAADPVGQVDKRNPLEALMLVGVFGSFFYMNLCTSLCRLRDGGWSLLMYLVFMLPIVGNILMIYFCGIMPRRAEHDDHNLLVFP